VHGKEEKDKEASKNLLLASCMDDTMIELVKLGSGSAQAKARRESREETTGRVRRSRGCSWAAHLVVRRRSSRLVCTAVYGIREASEARADKRVTS
jgi:hypothetical protein